MPFPDYLTLAEACQKGWELAQIEKRKQHDPAQLVTQLEAIADRAIAAHGAGTQADALAAFRTDATPAAAQTTIEALI
jgi:hypothetical protein